MPKKKTGKPFSSADMKAVSDNPAWTAKAMAGAKPFVEMFPKTAATIKHGRGPNKAPTKKLVSLRLSPDVIQHFKAKGPGWQVRIDDALRKASGVKR